SNELIERQELIAASEKIIAQVNNFTPVEWEEFIEQPPLKNSLELEIEEANEQINILEEELDKTRHQLAQLKVEFQRLESSEAYSEKMHQFESEKEKLTKLVR